ncbi:hypothetical protein [Gimesia chilikensis]|uniref:hypothetical protein n=1 Tax=Gimesia chilikensis TaxID=2605989 RepID=UPI001189D657|nr:hypothetical protein [Gimesia chilikensis]QDT84765.1 hypothetical protein MalM14_24280 [Gimesia chilikensis]
MVSIKCYGEDGLTLATVTDRFSELLEQLGDNSDAEECLVFYRPSFGRRGGKTGRSFGEFDAILATPHCVYLIESKWIRSRIGDNTIHLAFNQVLRHSIFEWLRGRWRSGQTWEDFRNNYAKEFSREFFGKQLARNTGALAINLVTVLNQLSEYPSKIEHILLAFCQNDAHQPDNVDGGSLDFRLINFQVTGVNMDQIFELNI